MATLHGFWRTADVDTVRDWLGPGFGLLVAVLLAVAVVAGYTVLWKAEFDRATP